MTTLHHDTLTFERDYPASPARVYAAFSSPEARARWAVPEGDVMTYDQADFSVGGYDVCRCGSPGALVNTINTRYLDIVPRERIVTAERTDRDGSLLGVSLNTLELIPLLSGTRLKMTIQLGVSDARARQGYQAGWSVVLEQLNQELLVTGQTEDQRA